CVEASVEATAKLNFGATISPRLPLRGHIFGKQTQRHRNCKKFRDGNSFVSETAGSEAPIVGNPKYRLVPSSNRYTESTKDLMSSGCVSVHGGAEKKIDALLHEEPAQQGKRVASETRIGHPGPIRRSDNPSSPEFVRKRYVSDVPHDPLVVSFEHPANWPVTEFVVTRVVDPEMSPLLVRIDFESIAGLQGGNLGVI